MGLSDYEQGWADAVRGMEADYMLLVTVLVDRLGGKVKITDGEIVACDRHRLRWYELYEPDDVVTVYETS